MSNEKKPVKKQAPPPTPISPEDQAVVDRLKEFGKRYKSATWKSNSKKH